MRQNGLYLGAEEDLLGILVDVERFLARSVACQDELARPIVPDAQCEHPVETLDGRKAAPRIEAQDHLRVSGRLQLLAARLEFVSQVAEVVDFSVERDARARLR